jgi:hypothetical protein
MITELHTIGIDPGDTTGWCTITVPYKSVFFDQPSEILSWDYGEFQGAEELQVRNICSLARTTQSLAYLTGPVLVVEDWDVDPTFGSTDPAVLSPVRILAMLRYAAFRNEIPDSRVVPQGRTIAKSTATDERLKQWGLYTAGSDHIRDATRHAITALRRAKNNPEFRDACWRKSH